jgi:hypothetical protein
MLMEDGLEINVLAQSSRGNVSDALFWIWNRGKGIVLVILHEMDG